MDTSFLLGSLLLACTFLPLYTAQESCSNRCGESYYRGNICHCDYNCLIHKECCKDYESSCTQSDSCKGRCGESFKRGRPCYCDFECTLYNQCCPDYQMHCGSEPQTSKLNTETDVNVAHTKSPPAMNEDITQDLRDNYLIPLSSPPSTMLAKEEIQGDESIGPAVNQVPTTAFEGVGPTATVYPESTSGQEPLMINTTEYVLSLDGTYTPLSTTGMPTLWSEQGAIGGGISTLFPKDLQLNESSMGTPAVTDSTDVSTSVPSRTSPSTIQSSDQLLATNKPTSDPTNSAPSTPRDETSVATPFSSSPDAHDASTTSNSVTPAQGNISVTPLLTGTSVQTHLPSPATATEADILPVGPDIRYNTQTDSPSPATTMGDNVTNSVKSDPPSPATATEGDITNTAKTDPPPSPATATAAGTLPTGGDITKDQTGGPTPAGEAHNIGTQPTPSVDATNAPMRPTPSPFQPAKRPTRPRTQTGITETLTSDNPNDYLPDNNDTNLCSGRPISGVTTLRNGTVVVFRGHYFWVLDANRSPSPARSITDVWGIPSPIDTVFTRCQCEGKTYFIKGNKYWRFENDVMDRGYPKPISVGFEKLAGKLTAALSVPATRKSRDSVYFFKTGGLVQKYTYKPSSACSRRIPNRVYLVRHRFTRQAASTETGLGKEINIKLQWRGFPSLVTSAVSIPNPRQPDGYDYYIFSRTKYYKVKLTDDQPTLTTPLTTPSQNSAKSWFNCP